MRQRAVLSPPWQCFQKASAGAKLARRSVFFAVAVGLGSAAMSGIGLGYGPLALADPPPAPAPERGRELIRLVRQDCGSCHGLTLRGGLGPALLPENLSAQSPPALKYTILFGRPGTAMPPWQPFMTEAEADWIVTQLLRGFPEEVK